MESDFAVELMRSSDSDILEKCNVDMEISSGDDDAASICKVRANSTHEIVKLSDSNHISNGITYQLCNMKNKRKVLSKDAINVLKRCFIFAVAQNTGNAEHLAACVRAIALHAFNNYEKCDL